MKYLITSALPYINGIKHLGNLIGSMLPADVYARFLRQKGHEVLYICGTDEHGTPAEIAAENQNMEVKEYCDQMFLAQKKTYDNFELSFDYFGRSSSQNNHKLTQDFFLALEKNGFIEEKVISQFYSVDERRFLPDRYIEGTCPKCKYDKARGDQCDECNSLLSPSDLIDPKSANNTAGKLEKKQTKHLFFKIQDLEKKIKNWIALHPEWPSVTKGIANKWINEGLHERCISRDLKWGVSIPKKEYDSKVFYVWFDAPIAYLSITKDFTENWQDWWKDSHDTHYVQFMAKDNVPFHAVFFPGMILGTKQEWKKVDYLKATNWLTYEGGKFSTSKNRGIFLDQATEIFPSDFWRYYLMASIPENSDSDFSFEHFASIVNKDLADVLGNLINRIFSLVSKYFDGKLEFYSIPENVQKHIDETIEKFDQAIYDLKFRHAMQYLRELWVYGNEYVASQQPWALIKTNPEKAAHILSIALFIIFKSAITAKPIIPSSSVVILDALGIKDLQLPKKWQIQKIPPLFQKISPEKIEELTEKFSGNK